MEPTHIRSRREVEPLDAPELQAPLLIALYSAVLRHAEGSGEGHWLQQAKASSAPVERISDETRRSLMKDADRRLRANRNLSYPAGD